MAITNNAFKLNNATTITQENTIQKATPFVVEYKNNKFSNRDKPITSRQCNIPTNKQQDIIAKTSLLLLKVISVAFTNSQLNTLAYNKDGSTLPLIYSTTNRCFFKICSTNIQHIIIDIGISIKQKINIIEETIKALPSLKLSEIQNYIAKNFLSSVANCLLLTDDFNASIVWQQLRDNHFVNYYVNNKEICQMQNFAFGQIKPYLPIDLLFIEREKRFIINKNNKKEFDLGRHAFDNEWLYMERCYRSFLFLLNKQIKTCHNISFADLRETNSILGANINPNIKELKAYYGCDIPNTYGSEFVNLVKTGLICDSKFSYVTNNLSVQTRMAELQDFLQQSLNINIKLKHIIFNYNSYFIINTTDDNTLGNLEDPSEILLNDLNGRTKNKAFLFKIRKKASNNKKNHPFEITIEYCYKKSRAEVCQQLLNIYYQKIKKNPLNNKQKIILAIELCSILQRIHPFSDGNGRTLFFILFPILLYQTGLWLTRMVSHPWNMLDFNTAETLAEKIIPLCVPSPIFKHAIHTWNCHITTEELLRIGCALGDIDMLSLMFNKNPRLINSTISITPLNQPITILNYVVINQQTILLRMLLHFFYKSKLDHEDLYDLLKLCKQYNFEEGSYTILKFISNIYKSTEV